MYSTPIYFYPWNELLSNPAIEQDNRVYFDRVIHPFNFCQTLEDSIHRQYSFQKDCADIRSYIHACVLNFFNNVLLSALDPPEDVKLKCHIFSEISYFINESAEDRELHDIFSRMVKNFEARQRYTSKAYADQYKILLDLKNKFDWPTFINLIKNCLFYEDNINLAYWLEMRRIVFSCKGLHEVRRLLEIRIKKAPDLEGLFLNDWELIAIWNECSSTFRGEQYYTRQVREKFFGKRVVPRLGEFSPFELFCLLNYTRMMVNLALIFLDSIHFYRNESNFNEQLLLRIYNTLTLELYLLIAGQLTINECNNFISLTLVENMKREIYNSHWANHLLYAQKFLGKLHRSRIPDASDTAIDQMLAMAERIWSQSSHDLNDLYHNQLAKYFESLDEFTPFFKQKGFKRRLLEQLKELSYEKDYKRVRGLKRKN